MVFAAALVLAQATQTVTFQSEAVTLRALMPSLSKATGMNLSAAKDIEWEVVYIRVKDVTPADLMAKVAEVTSGVWEKTADGRHILKNDVGADNRQRDEERKEFFTALTAAMKKEATNQKASASDKALIAIAQRIGVPTLVAIPQGQRVVYSTAPTGMQRPLGAVNDQIVESIVLEHNKSVDRQGISEGNQIDNDEIKKMEAALPPELLKMTKAMEEATKPKRINGSPAKINVAFSQRYGTIQMDLTMYDANGQILTSQANSIGNREFEDVEGGVKDDEGEGQEKKPEPDKTPVIKFTPETSEIIALQSYDEGLPASAGKTKAIRDRMLNFATKDPFLSAYTEVLNGYAQHETGNIVVNVDDSFMTNSNSKQATVRDIETEQLGAEKEKGWVTNTAILEGPRINRDVLIAAIGKISKIHPIGLEEKAWLAANEAQLGGDYNAITTATFAVFDVETYSWRNKPLLKIYGGLSTSQRLAARQGSGLAISSLSGEQRRLIETVCFGADFRVRPYGAGGDGDFDEEMFFNMDFQQLFEKEMASQKARKDYLMEPTESMPSGVPSGAFFKIDSDTVKAYVPISKNPHEDAMEMMGETGGVTMEMLASMMSMGEMMGQPEMMGMMPTEVKHAMRETTTFTLRCTDQVGYSERHREAKIAPDAKVSKITELGPDFDKLLAKRKEDMKVWKPMFEMGMGFGGGRRGTPPPLR